jgi:tRNA (adenine37-N6)-methyltransferase
LFGFPKAVAGTCSGVPAGRALSPEIMDHTERPGEIGSALDPARLPADAGLVFIGRAHTPWMTRDDCPKNLRQARERGGKAWIVIDEAWRPGLRDLSAGEAIVVLTWMDRARRDLVIQAPRHRGAPAGVFSIRSPVRPNPIALHVVRILSCDAVAGRLDVDALDCLDGTPVLDIKPWRASVDILPEPTPGS